MSVGMSLHWDCSHMNSLGLFCGFGPVTLFFHPMEAWEEGKKAGLTSVSPPWELGGSQRRHLAWEVEAIPGLVLEAS